MTAHEFTQALAKLKKLSNVGVVWADCEAMERRHNVGHRSLIVLDLIPDSGSPTYEERWEFLELLLPLERMSLGEGTMPEDLVLLAPFDCRNERPGVAALTIARSNQPQRPGRCV